MIPRAMTAVEPTHTDLASETSRQRCLKHRTTYLVMAATISLARAPLAAIVRSSTYSASSALGHHLRATTTTSRSMMRSSVVAKDDPAVMPRDAQAKHA